MKYFSSFAFAAAGMLLSACSNEDIMGVEQAPSPSEEILNGICATLPQSPFETTRMNHSADVEGINSVWQLGDTLGIYPIGGTQVDFPISDGAGTSRALFDGGSWALRSSYNYAAYYPYSRSNVFVKETELGFDYTGQEQDGNGSMTHLSDYDFLAAGATTPDRNGTVDLMLNHLGCFVRIDLTFTKGTSLKTLSIASNNAQFVTVANVDLSAASPALSPITTSASVDLALQNITAEAGEMVTLYMMMAPVDLSDSELVFTVIDNNDFSSHRTLSRGKNMEAGNAYCYALELDNTYDPFNGHDYVDLGLKDPEGNTIYWATCNVGASAPEESGLYFAWGETTGYSLSDNHIFDWAHYKFEQPGQSSWMYITKYTFLDGQYNGIWYDGSTFIGDGKTVLEPEDDAATQNWGGEWRMPTSAEIDQLLDNCDWSWTSVNGTEGYMVSNKSDNSKYIFLPASGYVDGSSHNDSYSFYLSSSLGNMADFALNLMYQTSARPSNSTQSRCSGQPVRAVCVYEE